MNNRVIKILLALLSIAIIVFVVRDYTSKRPDKSSPNPWEYNVDEFREVVDPSMIHYSEIINISLDQDSLRGLAYYEENLYVVGDNFLQLISAEGKEIAFTELKQSPVNIAVNENGIFIAGNNFVKILNHNRELVSTLDIPGERTLITSIAAYGELLFIADAGSRRVLRYNTKGEYLGEFDGKSEADQIHGFIIPSMCFDLATGDDGELWVVNPGKHALELYSHTGRLMRYWRKPSFTHEGFSGCCNPVHIAFLPDGSFVTSEKGIVRIKIHEPYGDFNSYVAPPEKFKDALYAPAIAVGNDGLIYALDFNTGVIRVFEKNGK